ncbi:uncharacterized protein LOC103717421 isoform X2 [Phoenix dactylifera]|uniref:Uncharacterized protein LOC103717421 isoform X2 n=1 Tax=Phoenix dactylifera TaxID=42345 RepID=A0A8B9A8Y1_PHODC|nr:uncharacterized protein LOC103717421 isoform X2 [Phoenix dactylifera]
MTSQCWPSKSNRSSTRYWWVPMEVQSLEPNTFFLKEDVSISRAKSNAQSETKAPSNRVGDSHLPVDSYGIDKVASQKVSNDLAHPYESTTRKKVLTDPLAMDRMEQMTTAPLPKEILLLTYLLIGVKEVQLIAHLDSANKKQTLYVQTLNPQAKFLLPRIDCNVHDNSTKLHDKLVHEQEPSLKHWLSIQNKIQNVCSNNRHAIAGALAGALVSLCLHPVDTVKTIIQANGMGQKSTYLIVRRIISEKGTLGLYCGIASNIASSAPISAIYTFTYESVKGALLPLLPKEYHSLAHCITGGCSSIATSFVSTPSERIKQQMQECYDWMC